MCAEKTARCSWVRSPKGCRVVDHAPSDDHRSVPFSWTYNQTPASSSVASVFQRVRFMPCHWLYPAPALVTTVLSDPCERTCAWGHSASAGPSHEPMVMGGGAAFGVSSLVCGFSRGARSG